ncbi:hypothetical protein [Adlercreutzia sp. ZJ304]|uniref:prenylated flavin chaperone LpdD n=1 Tax=Adlercreutzia sp. ZJ304 TaxID=2709791 RepID=UPI0019808E3E|nr:hypothetical protein [Adlercreutzia sp. ZJ304]
MGGYAKEFIVVRREVLSTVLELKAHMLGEDICVVLSGGVPHIGCSVVSIPRPSLTGDRSSSATSSTINVVGHKDDVVCRAVSETLCKQTGHVVVCTGGFHIDDISAQDIEEVVAAATDALAELVELIDKYYQVD